MIFGVSQIRWENSPWKQLSLVNDEEVISLSHAKVCIFSDSVLRLGKVNQNPASNAAWEKQYNTELWTQSTENRWNSSGIFSTGFTAMELVCEIQMFMSKMGEPEQLQGRIIFMSMSMTSYGEIKTLKRNVLLIPHLCLYSEKDFQQDIGHSSDRDQKQSGILLTKKDQEENGTKSLN